VLRYLGSTVNVVACSLALVALVVSLLTGAGVLLWPIVVGAYALGAVLGWLVVRRRGGDAQSAPTSPRRAAF
jgi:predicted membrane-bound spermidine synthase